MKRFLLRWETVLYAVAVLLGLCLRLVSIGRLPLSDAEAELALQAAAIASGKDVLLAPQPGYLALTSLLMYLTDATDWTARFWPAVAGALLILTPLFFRRWLGRFAAVLLAFGLAFDPGLLAAARHADGLMLAMLGLAAAAGFAIHGKPAWGGIAAGLALMGGPSIWPGLAGVGGALLLSVWLHQRGSPVGYSNEENWQFHSPVGVVSRYFLAYLVGTLFFLGTMFFSIPRGLGAVAGSLPGYLASWGSAGVSSGLFLSILIGYEFLPLLLGLGGAAGGLLRKNPLDRFLALWWVLAFALAVVNPGRQPVDIAWCIVPAGILAARLLARFLALPENERLPILGQGLLAALLLGFVSLSLLSLANNWETADRDVIVVRLAGGIILLIASTVLIGWGWSKAVTVRGIGYGALLVAAIYAASVGWHSAALSPRANREAWDAVQALPDQRLLADTLHDLRAWSHEQDGPYSLVVSGVRSPALRWALRDDPSVRFVEQLPRDGSPALVITSAQPDLALAAAYRGQSFVLSESVDWAGLRTHQWLRWVAFRVVPGEMVRRESLILWARGDLFPGGSALAEEPAPGPDLTGPESAE